MSNIRKQSAFTHAGPSPYPAFSTLSPTFSRSASTRFSAEKSAILPADNRSDRDADGIFQGGNGIISPSAFCPSRYDNMHNTFNINLESLINTETERLANKLGKSFLDCEDIVRLTGLGRDNARSLMHNHSFPVVKVGNRQVVSILAFVTWQMREYLDGDNRYGNR